MVKVSIIIPAFNEEKVIKDCLESLDRQTFKDMEVIVVDDGSTDKTLAVLQNFQFVFQTASGRTIFNFQILEQNHKGPGLARNLGVKHAKGEILVFVDADMTFDKDFTANLVAPIIKCETIGTFSKEEYVLNKDNVWSKCWNMNKELPLDKMHPKDYPDEQPVFRAILKKEFDKVGGFSTIGYIDDYSLSEKLGVQAVVAPGAIFYHKNPENLMEVWSQARWIGKSEYKRRKIKNENLMRSVALVRYSFPISMIYGLQGSIKNSLPEYLIFKIIYDLAIEISLFGSFFGEQPYK